MEKVKVYTLSMAIEKSVINRIDVLARKAGISRAKLCQNIIRETVGVLEVSEKVGLFDVVLLIRKMSEAGKEVLSQDIDIKRNIISA